MNSEIKKEAVEVVSTELVFPNHTNHLGTIFGGRILELMDMTGGLAAMQFCNKDAVTASFEAVDFKRPIKQGDMAEFRAKVIYTSRTSMVVKVDVFRVGKYRSEKEFTCRGYATMVAIDGDGVPSTVPGLIVKTNDDKKWHEIGAKIKRRAKRRAKQGM